MPRKSTSKKSPKKVSRKKPKSSVSISKKRRSAAKEPARPKARRAKAKTPKRKPSAKKRSASGKRKATLKKSTARKAIRSAVARRATKKRAKKPAKKSPKKPSRKTSPKRKAPSKKKPQAKSRKAPKPRRTRASPAASAPKPKSKEERLGTELNRAEISKLLSDRYTRHLVIESGGEYALEIIRGFNNNSSDEDMAKKLKIKISDVRATLNKLHSLGVVDYTRHKDSETGWFSYYWFLNVEKMKGWVAKKIDDDHRRMDFSRGEHYYCPGCGGASIHDFVSASDFGFKCPTCSGSLDYLSEDKANELFPMRSMRKPLL